MKASSYQISNQKSSRLKPKIKKDFKMTRINIFILTICSLLIAGVIGYKEYSGSDKLYFVIEMEASTSGISQIFFDTGRGYNEQDSSALQIQPGAFRKYSFPLPATTIRLIGSLMQRLSFHLLRAERGLHG